MTDQEQESTQQTNTEQEVNQDNNIDTNQEEEFLVIRGRYKYGGRNKTYGIFELISEPAAAKFNYVDLGSSSTDEIYDLFLDLSNQEFRDELQQLVDIANSQDKNITKKMRKRLAAPEVMELLTEGQEEEAEELIKEKIEDEVQEEIQLELNWGFLSRSELIKIYPDRFELDDAEDSGGDLSDEELEGLSDYEGVEEGLNAEIKLNCSPVISAISGKLITSFDIGDEILVRITDRRDLTGELENKIKVSNGLGVGTIEKIEYKEEVDRYKVLVELGDRIYGQLVVGPKVMLSFPEAKGDVAASDLNNEVSSNSRDNNDTKLIVTIVGLFLIIIILLLLYL
ncbi:hypothetical protein [Halanaerobacter jeridensis]|uniref:Uncharacterized protein n=1 Tax=Halanaerobacter jeridensis TaxID=706427 RepID=A0A939BST9_9FIRM|nr:hypothetical protein [Halanaerobacter jeridensis]MBM7557496.1 hypothetical protein [Halanaerobacter jeridensis]